ncbi:MAG: 23S rRNA (guanosine(2251)-2'-O)-methyltransferase RlmB [Candidatus Roseilinea sp.]|nr:MAG: 23S rRNA (guanosine(2251)-2'-O)-methyltransferase RlmB [Candidatus Roseilinea sp.]
MECLYSRQAVRECLRAHRRAIHRLLIGEGVEDAPIIREIRTLAQQRRIPISTVRRDALNAISPHAQGVALEVGAYPYAGLEDIFAEAEARGEPPFILILDSLQDPQNFGSLIRTAEAAGLHGVVIGERRSVGVTPAVVNASSGASEHLRVAQVVNLARAVEAMKARDVWVAALHAEAPRTIYEADLRGALALIVGSEGEGVSRLLRDKADFVLRLPMRGRVASLNAAVAGAVAIYEALRQRAG